MLTTFHVAGMDCAAEEQLIRLQVEGMPGVVRLVFDIQQRQLGVYHQGDAGDISAAVAALGLGDRLLKTEAAELPADSHDHALQRRMLWWVLAINAIFFGLEFVYGLMASSVGLIADSFDMLADALVYGLSLLVVGGTLMRKRQIARTSGYIEFALAILGFAEVVRRVVGPTDTPDFVTMITVAALAMVGNIACLWLLQRAKSEDVHMQASMIFTSNDVVVNFGVILSGVLVFWTQSPWPDLAVGVIIFIVLLRGGIRIMRLTR